MITADTITVDKIEDVYDAIAEAQSAVRTVYLQSKGGIVSPIIAANRLNDALETLRVKLAREEGGES